LTGAGSPVAARAMKLLVTGRNVDITPALRQLIDRKLTKLDRVLNDTAVSAQVILRMEKYRHMAEVTIHARGDHMLHGVGVGHEWPGVLKQAVEKIAQQAHRLKGRWSGRKRRASGSRTPPPVAAAEAPAPGRRVIRASRYIVKPMNVEDAALQVEAGRDSFIVFRNAASDTVNILYRRKDGNLGLIEPEP
jgi:putative sigma-54 modulation protein